MVKAEHIVGLFIIGGLGVIAYHYYKKSKEAEAKVVPTEAPKEMKKPSEIIPQTPPTPSPKPQPTPTLKPSPKPEIPQPSPTYIQPPPEPTVIVGAPEWKPKSAEEMAYEYYEFYQPPTPFEEKPPVEYHPYEWYIEEPIYYEGEIETYYYKPTEEVTPITPVSEEEMAYKYYQPPSPPPEEKPPVEYHPYEWYIEGEAIGM